MDTKQRLGIKHTTACDRGRCFCETNRYIFIFFVSLSVFGGEFVGARIAGSLSLLADSFHTLMDGITVLPSIGVALYAVYAKRREKVFRRLVAFFSSVLLAGASYYILKEAWERYLDPHAIDPFAIMGIAGMALVGNGIALWVLGSREDGSHAITHRGMSYHIASDLAQSAAVMVGGALIHFTGVVEIDVVLSVLIALSIFRLAVILFAQAMRHAT